MTECNTGMVSLNILDWVAVNDDVMGGVSTSTLINAAPIFRAEGMLSTQNNGGFNSMRTTVKKEVINPLDTQGLKLVWLGSERPFQCIIHLKNRRVREYYRAWLSPNQQHIQWSEFQFRRRGTIDPTRSLVADREYIEGFGVLLSDGVDGTWWFELHKCHWWMKGE